MSASVVDSRCKSFFEPPHDYKCAVCDNLMGIFTCHGCSKTYCQLHATQHREPLRDELEGLIDANQKLNTDIDVGEHSTDHKSLERAINEWEEKSIEKIRQAAAEARRKLSDAGGAHGNSQLRKVQDCHKAFTARLERAVVKNDYHEQHIKYWRQFLDDLRQNYIVLQTNYAQIEYYNEVFIQKISIVGKPVATHFTKWCYFKNDLIQTIGLRQSQYSHEDGCSDGMGPCDATFAITRPSVPRESIVVGRGYEYADEVQTGEYRFRLDDRYRFIGIMTKNEHQKNAPLNTPSVYGWCTTEAAHYRDGYRQFSASNDLHPGDTVSLIISSEQQMIALKNLTRNRTLELPIDLRKCPLPWQLKIVVSKDNYE